MTRIEERIAQLIDTTVAHLVEVVREDTRERIIQAFGSEVRRDRAHADAKRGTRRIRSCRVPGCGQPSKGPRYRYLCASHRVLPPEALLPLLSGGAANGRRRVRP